MRFGVTFQVSSAKPSNIFIQKSSLPWVPGAGVHLVDGLDEGVVVVAGVGIGVACLARKASATQSWKFGSGVVSL